MVLTISKNLRLLAALIFALTTDVAFCQTPKEVGDPLFRVSYCAGVLEEMHRFHSANIDSLRNAFAKNFCDNWQAEAFPTRETCVEQKSQEALDGTRIKLERYVGYLQRRRSELKDVEAAKSSALIAMGRSDQMTSWTRSDRRDFACGTSCRQGEPKLQVSDLSRCVADCIERYDPVQAGIYRCIVLPDN